MRAPWTPFDAGVIGMLYDLRFTLVWMPKQ
jgi:hypothetical protein